MKAKRKLGTGLKKKIKPKKGGRVKRYKKQKRVIPILREGGFLPLLLPILAALGALGGGAARIAKAVNYAKANKQQLAEQQRDNLALEKAVLGKGLQNKGKGLYLAPYKKTPNKATTPCINKHRVNQIREKIAYPPLSRCIYE